MKEYPQIDLGEWTMVGEGFNGQAYVSGARPGVMLKLITTEMGSAQKVEQEFYAARTAFEMGLQSSPLVTDQQRERLQALVEAMPETENCLHGDFQPGNIILAGGQHYWIDLGWLSQGFYMMDLAHLYKMMVEDSVIPQVQDLTHMTQQQMVDFWNAFAVAYTGTKDVDALNRELRPYAALDLARTGHLHHMDNPGMLEFFKARITQDLS